ncbi:diaminohydroxyphosphoribosylaminopyrimidine deaminase/5-amino-6-(5-phosphoribosylamino)uracil reductase [Leucobacter exalbidus]|uniref:Riboflavin biosynthesis protein RibD n=1 Tax=Leucobacter exalbidus TaxID=662960 RepID=A0A940PX73_9MICO|nr:bifunctional diaminohydroxyphosphoribosylaminopyrimidine deaminase/5-amino-6-(5-phosphoribosylamino)uracil reductase RibD [Leucobacter exalbidus]MBP1326781.1 diaminohydroxyphosphoribosylaminopyrimidine deaminase/5-amino-6-(5-phosphoribosylamino)uracil reductase [Leucobacter exalbidus]
MLDTALIEDAMHRALRIARRGPAPDANPQVGCVLLDGSGAIVAEGWHLGSGSPHAEAAALARLPESWRARAGELTAVVTLEPCNHTGRTGPCAVALREAGIGAVVYAMPDPGGASSGGASAGGAETLRAAGVAVESGVLAAEARELLRDWLAAQASQTEQPEQPTGLQRPRVIVKWAQTLDGRAAAADGSSQWITGPEARADVHRRRAAADAILVGTGTLLADDPSLTARASDGSLLVPAAEQPIPVVLGRRPIPADARIHEHPALAAHGRTAPLQFTGEDFAADFAALAAQGITSVFIEGGPAIISAVIAAGLADEALVYVAPSLLGGPRCALGDLEISSIADILPLRYATVTQLGTDWLIAAEFDYRPGQTHAPTPNLAPALSADPAAAPALLPTHTPKGM